MRLRATQAKSPIEWARNQYGPLWAKIGGVEVGAVRETTIKGQWISKVMHTADWRRDMHCYTSSEARAKYFVERYYSHHVPDPVELARGRKAFRMADVPPLPRKPKGSDDRS